MAETATFTYDTTGPIKRILLDWTSAADGTCSGVTRKVSGYILAGITDPGAAAPTANYDIVLNDDETVNILGNCNDDLADRHTSTSERVDFIIDGTGSAGHPAVCSTIAVEISNAGDSKTGQLIILIDGEILPHET